MPGTHTAHSVERLVSHAVVTRAPARGNRYFLSDDVVELDPLFSELLEVSDLEPLDVSALLSDDDSDPLLPDEPLDDDFFA
jgi:hypothetical protein